MDSSHDQQVTTAYGQSFRVVAPEHLFGEVEFGHDRVDFCFIPAYLTDEMKCFVRIFDERGQEPLGNVAHVVVEEWADDRKFVCFSSFGWRDEAMLHPVGRCGYEIWLEARGGATVDVQIYV
ncbi:hypothetical protein [Lentzea sp. NPDC059081]|uniref:hypothetical protein n=1 Tax=Lentzea sp. NPDC059081 TaxID=3346719 RepID=UPI0036AE272D